MSEQVFVCMFKFSRSVIVPKYAHPGKHTILMAHSICLIDYNTVLEFFNNKQTGLQLFMSPKPMLVVYLNITNLPVLSKTTSSILRPLNKKPPPQKSF